MSTTYPLVQDLRHPVAARAAAGPRGAGLVDLRAFWNLLRRRLRLIATVAAAILTLVVIWLILSTPRFTATAVLIVDHRQQRVLPSEAVLAGIGSDAAAVESQVEVIQSTAIARAVITKLGLMEDSEFTKPSLVERVVGTVRDVVGMAPRDLSKEEREDRVLAKFEDRLRVARRGLTYVLEIRFTAEKAERSAAIANAVAAAYLADQSSAKLNATSQAADFLNDRLGELRRRVSDAERAVATYKAQNNIVDAGEGRTLADRQITELNQQLIAARARSAEARARLDQVGKTNVAAVGSGAIPEALLSPVVSNLRAQYAEAARREAEILSTLGPRHPAVSTARAQLADIRMQIEREIARVTTGVRNEFDVAQSRERTLEKNLADLKVLSGSAGQASVRLRELEREAQASRTLLEQALLRFRETTEQEGLQRPDARVLSPAATPLKPSEPKTALILLAGIVGSLIGGIGAAGIAESLSRGYRTARDVESSLAIPVLGHLPLIGSWDTGRRKLRGPAVPVRVAGRPEAGDRIPAGRTRSLARYGVDQPLSPFGEALRTVRMRLATDAGGRSQVLAIVSSVPNEGKSTVAVNLAHSFAKSGLSTILVDVDVRNPGVFGAGGREGPGLIQVLESGGSARHQMSVDPVSGLHMMPLGRVDDVAAASELVTGPAMGPLVDKLRSRYQVVVLDAPPLLPFVDGRSLLDLADAGLFVVEWNRTDPESASAALDTIGPSVGKIAGILLNKVDLRAEGFHGYGYGDAYGYRAAS